MIDKLEKYYSELDEDNRLKKESVHYIEFLTTTTYFDKVFPEKCRILDPCAGTGSYAFYLAEQGHRVVAGDVVTLNVEMMKEKQTLNPVLDEVYLGDVLDLSRFADESFDVVLCMGALYHLLEKSERYKAVKECLRVLKKGGIFVGSHMNKCAVVLQNCQGDIEDIDEILTFIKDGKEEPFYVSSPSEIVEMMKDFSLEKLYHIGADGIGYLMYGIANLITKEGFERWRRYHFATCEEESILGYSYHGVYIGKKTT